MSSCSSPKLPPTMLTDTHTTQLLHLPNLSFKELELSDAEKRVLSDSGRPPVGAQKEQVSLWPQGQNQGPGEIKRSDLCLLSWGNDGIFSLACVLS